MIDHELEVLIEAPNIPQMWIPSLTEQWFEQRCGYEVSFANDADLAAVGESSFGAGRDHRDVVYVTISTGIGAGIVVGGTLVRGRLSGGEIGHTVLDIAAAARNEPATVEELGSATAFNRSARLAGITEQGKELVDLVRSGHERATQVFERVDVRGRARHHQSVLAGPTPGRGDRRRPRSEHRPGPPDRAASPRRPRAILVEGDRGRRGRTGRRRGTSRRRILVVGGWTGMTMGQTEAVSEPEIVVEQVEPSQWASRAADITAEELTLALTRRSRATLAVSGGRSPKAYFAELSQRPVPWGRITILQVDERVVPEGSPERNLTDQIASFGDLEARWLPLPVSASEDPRALNALSKISAKTPETHRSSTSSTSGWATMDTPRLWCPATRCSQSGAMSSPGPGSTTEPDD